MKNHSKAGFRKDLQKIMILQALIPVFLLTIIFVVVLTYAWNASIIDTCKQNSQETASEMNQIINNYYEEIQVFAGSINVDQFLKEANYSANVTNQLYNFLNSQVLRGDFYLFNAEGKEVYSTANSSINSERFEWNVLRDISLNKERKVYMSSYWPSTAHEPEIQIGASVISGGKLEGYTVFVLAASKMLERTVHTSSTATVVTNRYDRIFFSTNNQFRDDLGKLKPGLREQNGYVKIENGHYYISSRPISDGDFYIYSIGDGSNMLKTIGIIIVLVACIFIGILIAVYWSVNRITIKKTKIVEEIKDAFYAVERGDLETQIMIKSEDEFGIIGNSFNIMVKSLKNLIERNKMQEHETAIARIKQLESQLNPHFLFNTMENVRFMIRLDPKVADKMIVGLSNLLRYSIKDDNNKSVTLGVEIEHTRDYLTLLHYRFGERFYYEINVQDQLENALIPRLLFQPIVENSVVHGLEGKEEIHVALSVSRADQVLLIDINDDGAGMSDETLDQLRSSLQSNEYETYHIGICNVHQRIRLLYGDSYGLHINSELGKGTSIQIRLPYIL